MCDIWSEYVVLTLTDLHETDATHTLLAHCVVCLSSGAFCCSWEKIITQHRTHLQPYMEVCNYCRERTRTRTHKHTHTHPSKWLFKHTAVSMVSLGTSRGSAVLAGEGGGAMLPVGAEVMVGLSLPRLASWMTPVWSGSSAFNSSVICERQRRVWGVWGWVPHGLSRKCRRSARVIQPASF